MRAGVPAASCLRQASSSAAIRASFSPTCRTLCVSLRTLPRFGAHMHACHTSSKHGQHNGHLVKLADFVLFDVSRMEASFFAILIL